MRSSGLTPQTIDAGLTEPNFTIGGSQGSRQTTEQGGLSGARGAEYGDKLAWSNGRSHSIERTGPVRVVEVKRFGSGSDK